jgi:hypothetical protein
VNIVLVYEDTHDHIVEPIEFCDGVSPRREFARKVFIAGETTSL